MNARRNILLSFGFLLVLACSALNAQEFEYQLKAEFLERFTRFIDWPVDSVKDPQTPFVICIAGVNPFGSYLDEIAREVRIKGRKAQTRQVRHLSGLKGCDLLFVSSSEESRLKGILKEVDRKPVLTVADTEGYAAKGIMINLFEENDFLRFEINRAAAARSGFRINSRLLNLARIVEDNSHEDR